MPETLRSWFGLVPDRDSFKPKIPEDCGLAFCHRNVIESEILPKVKMRYAANEPVKMMINGDWGVGKTHAAHHLCKWLADNQSDYPVETVMIELGDIEEKSRFDVVVRPFLDKLGKDFLITLAWEYLQRVGNVINDLKVVGIPDDVAVAISKLNLTQPGDAPQPVSQEAIEVLKGNKADKSYATHGLGKTLADSGQFYGVLHAIGHMHKKVRGSRMLFIADEGAKLETVESNEAIRGHWITTNRLIFDDANSSFGFIYTLSAKGDKLPRVLWDPQIESRMGGHRVQLKQLGKQDVAEFLDLLREEFIEKAKVEQLVSDGTIPSAEYRWDSYPFTDGGRSEFIDFFDMSSERSKPRDICEKLNSLGWRSINTNKRLIDEDCLRAEQM